MQSYSKRLFHHSCMQLDKFVSLIRQYPKRLQSTYYTYVQTKLAKVILPKQISAKKVQYLLQYSAIQIIHCKLFVLQIGEREFAAEKYVKIFTTKCSLSLSFLCCFSKFSIHLFCASTTSPLSLHAE